MVYILTRDTNLFMACGQKLLQFALHLHLKQLVDVMQQVKEAI